MSDPNMNLGISDDDAIMVRIDYFDASALVMAFSNESRSATVQNYLRNRGSPTTTQFCFYETLSILKGKTGKPKDDPLYLSWENYLSACRQVLDFYRAHVGEEYLEDPSLVHEDWADQVMTIATNYKLDLSDALQIVSVKFGVAAGFAKGSQTILVTGDKRLCNAAVKEGLRVWYVFDDPPADAHDNSLWARGGRHR